MTSKKIAEKNLIMLGIVGSTLHGLNVLGQDDHDEMGICIEPPEYVIGLKQFEQHVFRTKPEGIRSEAGDTDRTIYSLRKYVRLALKGNPTVQLLLYHPTPNPILPPAIELQRNAWRFISRRAGQAFLGYLVAQKQRLLGERGQMDIHRPELVEKYGYDTKYAMHMLRLGYQGVELLENRLISLPMREPDRKFIYDVRCGKHELDTVFTRTGQLEKDIEDLLDTVPSEPDYEWANSYLIRTYLEWWNIYE